MGAPPIQHNEDVLYCIFEHLAIHEHQWYAFDPPHLMRVDGGPEESEDSRLVSKQKSRLALARCARVCRAFFRPAASVLWRYLDDTRPLQRLIQYLPHDAPDSTPSKVQECPTC